MSMKCNILKTAKSHWTNFQQCETSGEVGPDGANCHLKAYVKFMNIDLFLYDFMGRAQT